MPQHTQSSCGALPHTSPKGSPPLESRNMRANLWVIRGEMEPCIPFRFPIANHFICDFAYTVTQEVRHFLKILFLSTALGKINRRNFHSRHNRHNRRNFHSRRSHRYDNRRSHRYDNRRSHRYDNRHRSHRRCIKLEFRGQVL